MNIPYGKHYLDYKDIDIVNKVLKSDILTQGNIVTTFENKVKKMVNCKYALAVNSASSALQIACMSFNIKKNDIVWTSPITFAASANCALNLGAKIDFVDINDLTYNIDINKLEEKLILSNKKNSLPKILITVHLAGQPTYQEKIWNLAKKYNFKIIEDASHSMGAKRKNHPVGNCKWSDITVFSFHPVKMITTIEGGMALTNNFTLFKKMDLYRNNGITKNKNYYKSKNDYPWYYEMQSHGYNFRMNEVQSALGLSQLNKINYFVKKRNQIADFYNKSFKKYKNVVTPFIDKDNYSSYHLYILRLKFLTSFKKKSELMKLLIKNNIFLNIHYIPLHLHPYFKKVGFKKGYLPSAEKYYLEAISLPIYFNLKESDKNKVFKFFKSIIRNE